MLTKANRKWLTKFWDEYRHTEKDRQKFTEILVSLGWREIESISFKQVLVRGDLLVKFDAFSGENNKRFQNLRQEHTVGEWNTFHYAKSNVRKFLAPIVFYHKGLIIQRKIPECKKENFLFIRCPDALKLASVVGTSHWYHHAHMPNGSIKFFDYDKDNLFESDRERLKKCLSKNA